MSLINAYSIFDRKTVAYFPPFYAPTDAGAIRSLSDLVSDQGTTVGRHPNDYVLYRVGVFDDAKGALVPEAPIAHVIDAIALVKAMQHEIPFPDLATSKGNADAGFEDRRQG